MINREADIIHLEGDCPVEDAEVLLQQIQQGASALDWSDCTFLHTACVQVILAAGLSLYGTPASDKLTRWLAPLLPIALPTLTETEN
jgi:hypothetical protein